MKFDGEFTVDGSPEEVWPYFNDPDILQDCAPGCKELVLESPSQIRASLEVGVGSVKPSFEVSGIVVECDEPNRLELQASGEASRNSFDVTAWQELAGNGDGTTTVTWQADAEVSGVIASLGERALGSVTDKLVSDFFEDIEEHINAGTPAEAKFSAADETEVRAAAEATAAAREGDLVDDLLEAVGALRGGGDETTEGVQATDGRLRSFSAGVAAGAVGGLLWSRLRRRGGGADGADGGTADGARGGTLRLLVVGAILGVLGKMLWDAYSSSAPSDREAQQPEAGTEQVEAATAGESVADQPGDATAASAADRTDESADASDGAAEEGMIDDPLDRLN